ncbi:MAG: hypothetical protein WBG34_01655 [Flavobacteriales bacterium]
MSYKLMIRLAARDEAAEIHDWYEARSKGLGTRFADALEECLRSIQQNPKGLQIRKGKFRHDLVSRFRIGWSSRSMAIPFSCNRSATPAADPANASVLNTASQPPAIGAD